MKKKDGVEVRKKVKANNLNFLRDVNKKFPIPPPSPNHPACRKNLKTILILTRSQTKRVNVANGL